LSRSKNSLSQLNEIKKQDKTQERVNA
jgi:hypothetical protein